MGPNLAAQARGETRADRHTHTLRKQIEQSLRLHVGHWRPSVGGSKFIEFMASSDRLRARSRSGRPILRRKRIVRPASNCVGQQRKVGRSPSATPAARTLLPASLAADRLAPAGRPIKSRANEQPISV